MKNFLRANAVGIQILVATLGIFFVIACAEDTASISIVLKLDDPAASGADALDAVNEATSAGEQLTVRLMYTYPSRTLNGRQVVSVRPTVAVPVNAASAPRWETAVQGGFSFQAASLDLAGIPLGKTDTTIIVELLRRAQSGEPWFVIGYACMKFPGVALTADLLKSQNGQQVQVYRGRACGDCSAPVTYTDYDSTSEFCP